VLKDKDKLKENKKKRGVKKWIRLKKSKKDKGISPTEEIGDEKEDKNRTTIDHDEICLCE